MKINYKTGVLIFILSIPVFIILFLNLFGKNYFDLPVYFPIDSVQVSSKKFKVTEAHRIPSFQLIDQDSSDYSSKKLDGNIYVADFFFVTCPDICPQMTTQLTRVQEAFAGDDDVKIISFTVNPIHDVPSVLKNYALQYKADLDKWAFLTGQKDSIYDVALKGFKLSALEDMYEPGSFIHSEKLVLVDKQGWIRGYYNGTEKKDVDRLIREIQVLKYGYEH